MKNDIVKLFVYGTLRRDFHHPAYQFISKYFRLLDEATVRGKLYDLGEYPGAVRTSEVSFITGELYQIKEAQNFQRAIEQLDDYEGLNPEEGEMQLFVRQLTEVTHKGGTDIAWTYWYNKSVCGQPQILSGDVFNKTAYEPQS